MLSLSGGIDPDKKSGAFRHIGASLARHKRIAACLLSGMCALATTLPANAVTFNWSYTNTGGAPETGGTTSGTITGLQEGINDLTASGISLTISQSQNVQLTTLSSGSGGNGTITVSGGNVTDYDFCFQMEGLFLQVI